MVKKKYYKRWFEKDSISNYKDKKFSNFFLSEKYLLKIIKKKNIRSILDIGCASGRFYEVTKRFFPKAEFSGIDIVDEQINQAKKNYPRSKFYCLDFLNDKFKIKYDLLNATGVMQHEPRYKILLNKMINISKKFIIFDLKLIKENKNIVDIKKSFSKAKKNKLYFNLFSLKLILRLLKKRKNIKKIIFFGYETKPNNKTTIPKKVKKIFSCGVLIEKGKSKKVQTQLLIKDF
tara:strand:+ start:3446 stop:4144 length:699 start_codon:yes stop_codon:yes gene_type:complete